MPRPAQDFAERGTGLSVSVQVGAAWRQKRQRELCLSKALFWPLPSRDVQWPGLV